jgi:hypothetical protein
MALVAGYNQAARRGDERWISCPNCGLKVYHHATQLPVTCFKGPAGEYGGGTFVIVGADSMLHACALNSTERVVLLRAGGVTAEPPLTPSDGSGSR